MKMCFEEASRVLKHLNNTFCDEQTNTTQMHRFSGEFRQTLLDFFSIRIFSASGQLKYGMLGRTDSHVEDFIIVIQQKMMLCFL